MRAMSALNVAIVMDGNARWARGRGLPVLEGHREGAKTLKQTVRDAVTLGLGQLTVYAFSTENWTRPREEVEGLMAMFAELIESETPELHEEGVRMRFIGRRDEVSDDLKEQMDWAERTTAGKSGCASSLPSTTAVGPKSWMRPSGTRVGARKPSRGSSTPLSWPIPICSSAPVVSVAYPTS